MVESPLPHPAHVELAGRLRAAGHLVPGPVPGSYGRGGALVAVVEAFSDLARRTASAHPRSGPRPHGFPSGGYRVLRFPPVYPRESFERTDYVASFPDLTGTIHAFTGGDRDHAALLADRAAGLPWDRHLAPTGSVLVPAACHPVYATLTGELDEDGAAVDVRGWCFRHEPSADPMRMQSFQMHEFVRVDRPEVVLAHQRAWVERAADLLATVGLDAAPTPANDPFFGRAGRMLAASQASDGLKTELVVAVHGPDAPGTAVASSNNHRDHFGTAFDIRTPDGEPAHSTCVGFGLERVGLALFATHGMDPARWPAPVRTALDL